MRAKTRASRVLKFLDRFLGIPIIFILGCLRRKRHRPSLQEKPRIALLHTAAIGDTILLSGAVADLKKRWPESAITFFVGPSNFEAALLIPGIQVIQLPVTSILKAGSILRAQPFDLWIDFGSWARINALFSFFARASYKIGFYTPSQHRHFVYDATAIHQPIHELDNARNLLKLLGIKEFQLPSLVPFQCDQKRQIVLHLYAGGSRAKLKEWPEEHWVSLINALTKKGIPLILTGGRADQIRCERLKNQCQQISLVQVVAGTLSLAETARLLKSSLAIISIDTGIMHLAATLGCLTIALHGPTSFQRWGGIGPRVIPIVQSKKEPCIHLGFENRCSRCDCMKAIQVEHVLNELERYLKL